MGDLVEDVVRREPHDEIGRILVERGRREVGVALDLAGGEHTVPDLLDVRIELEVLCDRNAHVAVRPQLQDLRHERRPELDERVLGVVGHIVRLAAELKALHDVLVLVVYDPLHELEPAVHGRLELRRIGGLLRPDAGKPNQHLEAVLLPEVELRLRVRARLRVLVVAAGEPLVGAPGGRVVAAGLLHDRGCLVLVGDEPVVVAVGVHRADVADNGLGGRLREVAHRLAGQVEVDGEVGERAC